VELHEFIIKGKDQYLPNLSIDIVIIGYEAPDLKCLLLKIGQKWLLPGGYISRDESVSQASERILMNRTGLQNPHLRFLSVFGEADRRFGTEMREFIEVSGIPWNENTWVNDRFVSLTYYSMVNMAETNPVIGLFDEAYSWFDMDALPDMWMDHASIVREARERLKNDIQKEMTTFNLLPDHFTMPELHRLHQTILSEDLDRSRFQKKMLASGFFERLPRRLNTSPGRNPYQYRMKTKE